MSPNIFFPRATVVQNFKTDYLVMKIKTQAVPKSTEAKKEALGRPPAISFERNGRAICGIYMYISPQWLAKNVPESLISLGTVKSPKGSL